MLEGNSNNTKNMHTTKMKKTNLNKRQEAILSWKINNMQTIVEDTSQTMKSPGMTKTSTEATTYHISTYAKMDVIIEWNMGAIIQKENEVIEAEITWQHKGYPNPMVAEAQSIIHALIVSLFMGLRHIRVYIQRAHNHHAHTYLTN